MSVTLIMSGKSGTRSHDRCHGYVADESDGKRIVELLNDDPPAMARMLKTQVEFLGSYHFWTETVDYFSAPW